MCGIAAIPGFNETRADKAVVERMATSMWHRGPDGNGIRVAGPVGLGFKRLSILDVSHAADQPIAREIGSAPSAWVRC